MAFFCVFPTLNFFNVASVRLFFKKRKLGKLKIKIHVRMTEKFVYKVRNRIFFF